MIRINKRIEKKENRVYAKSIYKQIRIYMADVVSVAGLALLLLLLILLLLQPFVLYILA